MSSADASERVGFECGPKCLVHIDVDHVHGAVDGHGIVMPVVVIVSPRHLHGPAVGAEQEFFRLESDKELVASPYVVGTTRTVADECSASLGIGLKPEHQGVVLLGGA